MDKLTWFKFTPSDWMMGKIQRCPEITQSRFIRLCCLYWNKECNLSVDDSIIEIDKEHFDILISKKIICINEGFLNISFLDEQFLDIEEKSEGKSKSGIIGNLKRWHPVIYNRFNNKEISLEKAIELSKSIAEQSHTDSNTIAEQSQNIADKKREDKKREDNINWDVLLDFFNKATNKKCRVIPPKIKSAFNSRIKEGFTKEDIANAIKNCSKDTYHIETNYKYLTLEFISRADKLDKYSNIAQAVPQSTQIAKHDD